MMIEFDPIQHIHVPLHDHAVSTFESIQKLCFSSNEISGRKIMLILQNEEDALIDARKCSRCIPSISMDVPVAELMVHIVDAHLNEITNIIQRMIRDETGKLAVTVSGAMQ